LRSFPSIAPFTPRRAYVLLGLCLAAALCLGSSGSLAAGCKTSASKHLGKHPGSRLAQELKREVSVNFEGVPLRDALAFLSQQTGVNIVVSPSVDAAGLFVTLSLDRVSLRSALIWIARLTRLGLALKDEVIYFAPPEELAKYKRVAVYPVRDLMLAIIDRPRRPNILGERREFGAGFAGGIGYAPSFNFAFSAMRQDVPLARRGKQMVNLLTTVTGRERWRDVFIMYLPDED